MRFKYGETEFIIEFRHFNPIQIRTVKAMRSVLAELHLPELILAQLRPVSKRKRKFRPYTQCILSTVDRTVTPPAITPYLIADSKLHTGDTFCKSTGRAYAIRRVMEQIGNKELCRLVWQAYKDRAVKKEVAAK